MKKFFAFLAALLIPLTMAACGATDEKESVAYPTETITFIVPFSAGSVSSLGVQLMANALSKELPVPVVLEHIPGAFGEIGWSTCYNAQPDGYTVALANPATATLSLSGPVSYSYDEFEYLMATCYDPCVVVVPAESDIYAFEDLIEYAQKHRVLFAESGDTSHYAAIDIIEQTGIADFDNVPFNGSSEALLAVASGDCMVYCSSASVAGTMIDAGKIRPLMVLWNERILNYPDIPTSIESGYSDLLHVQIRGFVAPPNTPREICDTLTEAMLRAVERDDYKAGEEKLGFIRNILSGAEFKEQLDRAYVKYTRLAALEQSWNA